MVLNNAEAPRDSLTLDRLPVGQSAIVRDVMGEEPELIRLRVMGLCIGRGVHVLRGGSRMIACVGGTRIGLTSQVAQAVVVERVGDDRPTTAVPPLSQAGNASGD